MVGQPSSGVAVKAGSYSSRDPQSLGRPDPCSLPLVAGRRFGSPLLGTEEHQPDLTDEVLLKLARQLRLVGRQIERSEEHTSELQSLMRISYAVFCLKQKTKTNTH